MFFSYLKKISASVMFVMLLAGLVGVLPTTNLEVEAASEPECDQSLTTPTFNPYPITTSNPNPVVNNFDCQDMPMLSFFPIDTGAGNPREINIIEDQNITFHVYYNNGANYVNGGDITNPTLAIDVDQVNSNKFCISGTLSGSNAATLTSASQGGNLCINTPDNTELRIVANTVQHFPDAIERKEQAETTGASPSDQVADNSVGTTISNPIYTSFPGTNLPSTSGFRLKDSLEPGFLGYGYVLAQIAAFVEEPEENEPPVLTGQEITIVRGESGSFDPYAGTDPNGDIPLTYVTLDLPEFCTLDESDYTVECVSDEDTPVRTTFNVVPTDSKGLAGSSAPFIVNIIEADKAILATSTKTCVRIETEDNCETAKLQPEEKVLYTIDVTNTGKEAATNVIVVDDYDENLLEEITPLENDEISVTDTDGTLTFNVGTIEPDQTVSLLYEATIKEDVDNGVIVVNTAQISADDLPTQTVSTQFPVVLPNNPILEAVKKCVEYNTTTSCKNANLTPGDKVTYSIEVTNTGDTTAFNVQVEDDWDTDSLEDVEDISPSPLEISNPEDTITWSLGNLDSGEGKTITYTMTIQDDVTSGTKVENQAIVSADNLPNLGIDYDFLVTITPIVTERTGGSAWVLLVLVLLAAGGGYYYYKKNGKLGKKFNLKRSSKEK